MYNLIEYSDNSKTSGSLWQCYKDEPNDNLANSQSFKYKVKITVSMLFLLVMLWNMSFVLIQKMLK